MHHSTRQTYFNDGPLVSWQDIADAAGVTDIRKPTAPRFLPGRSQNRLSDVLDPVGT